MISWAIFTVINFILNCWASRFTPFSPQSCDAAGAEGGVEGVMPAWGGATATEGTSWAKRGKDGWGLLNSLLCHPFSVEVLFVLP